MDYSLLIGQINLGFQIAILLVLLAGFAFKRKMRFFQHGTAMFVAVLLNAISFSLVMGPSLAARIQVVEANPLGKFSLAVLGHAIIGGLAEILGIWLVASWHFQSSTKKCSTRKKIMLLTLVLWLVAILLGFVLFGYIANLIE